MNYRRLIIVLCGCAWLGCLITGCAPLRDTLNSPAQPAPATATAPPTPATQALQVSDLSSSGARLHVTLPSIKLLKHLPDENSQLFLALADPHGHYTYLLYPANSPGYTTDQFDLTAYPLELSIDDATSTVSLWILAVHNTRYYAAEAFGLDALASSLALGFRNWLDSGDPDDDPLAAVVSASDGALFEWFAGIDVLGQSVTTLRAEENWHAGLNSLQSGDGGLNVVYMVQYLSARDVALLNATPTPFFTNQSRPGYILRVDETFTDGISERRWYQGHDSTFINQITEGAYEIRLTAIEQRDYGLSWGSIEGESFKNYAVEAQVTLLEETVDNARYGLWFHYVDDYNFFYFGISNEGEYRVALIESNNKRREIQDWVPHPAVHPGAAINILTVETGADGAIALGINGERVLNFHDDTFEGGSVAFFCYAESVPATCRLERLRIWEPAG
jgi:hypothetical protein